MGWIYCLVPKLATKTVCPRFSTVNGMVTMVTGSFPDKCLHKPVLGNFHPMQCSAGSLSTTFFLTATTLHSAVKCSSWNKYLDLWLVHPDSCQNIQEMCINHCHCSQTFTEIVNGFVTFLTLEISCFPSACVGDLQYLSNVELYSHNVETICMFNLVIYPGTKGRGTFNWHAIQWNGLYPCVYYVCKEFERC